MKYLLMILFLVVGINQSVKSQFYDLPPPKTFKMEVNSGVEKLLIELQTSFKSENQAFLVNIWVNGEGTIQLVHPNFIKVTNNQDMRFGIAVSLNFDSQKELQNKFKQESYFAEFKYYEFDGIPSYAKNYGDNISQAQSQIVSILKNLYNVKDNTIIEFEIYDQGPIEYYGPN